MKDLNKISDKIIKDIETMFLGMVSYEIGIKLIEAVFAEIEVKPEDQDFYMQQIDFDELGLGFNGKAKEWKI